MEIVVSFLSIALKVVSLVFDTITYVPYYIIQRPDKICKRSKRIKAKPVSGKPSDAWRSVDVPSTGLTTSIFPECKTLDDLFSRACSIYVDQPCLGTRDVISEDEEVQPGGKVFKKLVLGHYQWETYAEVSTRVNNFGSGLCSLGHLPRSMLVIFAETRADWMVSAQTCFKYNFPMVTLYATLGVDAIIHGIKETEVHWSSQALNFYPSFRMFYLRHQMSVT
uniref:long-chain-fatty-acid--CoA ligase n=1 Tax=Arion vulgaris TaxID=1028688 RepID=A0A0B6YS27_9EUPU